MRLTVLVLATLVPRAASAYRPGDDVPPGSTVPVAVVANEATVDSAPATVSDVRVTGLKRTAPHVVARELKVEAGETLDADALEESVQRLKNTLLFSRVDPRVVPGEAGDVAIDFELDEKWTTIPILRGGSGGGTAYFVVGAYDINLLGRFLEGGAQYENLGGTSSGVVWFRNPRFLDRPIRVGADLWDATRVRSLYADGELEGAFTLRRQKVNLFVDGEVRRGLFLGAGVEIDSDEFSSRHQTPEQRDANLASGFEVPRGGESVIARATASAGRLDFDDYLVSGALATVVAEHAPDVGGIEFPLTRVTVEGRWFARLPLRSNLAARLTVGWTDSEAIQHQFYIGGLDYTRGLLDGQARGSQVWNGNLELRIPSVRTKWLVLQHVAFTDFGNIANDTRTLFGYESIFCSSTGVGVRVISPKIYRFVLRIDYGIAFRPHEERGVSFGVQQFF